MRWKSARLTVFIANWNISGLSIHSARLSRSGGLPSGATATTGAIIYDWWDNTDIFMIRIVYRCSFVTTSVANCVVNKLWQPSFQTLSYFIFKLSVHLGSITPDEKWTRGWRAHLLCLFTLTLTFQEHYNIDLCRSCNVQLTDFAFRF